MIGSRVVGVTDVNSDGVEDFAVSGFLPNTKKGVTYIIYGCFGGCSDLSLSTADKNPTRLFIIEGGGPSITHSVAWAGDVNKDGVDDVAIGTSSSSEDPKIKKKELSYLWSPWRICFKNIFRYINSYCRIRCHECNKIDWCWRYEQRRNI
jgi:hypothetical protein